MPVKININKHTLETKVQTAWDKGLAILTEGIKDDCNQYCKYENGALSRSADIHSIPKEGKIIWQTPYARRQYWEIKTNLSGDPKRTWKWVHAAKAEHERQWIRQAAVLMGVKS
jgi:hypothetical protein